MNSVFVTTRIVESMLLPPFSLLLLMVLGAWVARRRRRLGFSIIAAAWLGVLVLSLPVVSSRLKHTLEGPLVNPSLAATAQAIVVLGGGVRPAPEFGGDIVNAATLERLRYAAHLERQFKKPILVSGGNPTARTIPEAVAMKLALASDFGTDARWVEAASNNTWENARNSYAILAPLGIDRVLLVTHGWHMQRSRLAFERAGFKVIEAPMGLTGETPTDILAWVPSSSALYESTLALREWLGLAWYRLQSALR